MADENTLAIISGHIGRLNKAIGHRPGAPRVTLETATPAQRPLVEALQAWEEAHQYRLNLDSACSRAKTYEENTAEWLPQLRRQDAALRAARQPRT